MSLRLLIPVSHYNIRGLERILFTNVELYFQLAKEPYLKSMWTRKEEIRENEVYSDTEENELNINKHQNAVV